MAFNQRKCNFSYPASLYFANTNKNGYLIHFQESEFNLFWCSSIPVVYPSSFEGLFSNVLDQKDNRGWNARDLAKVEERLYPFLVIVDAKTGEMNEESKMHFFQNATGLFALKVIINS